MVMMVHAKGFGVGLDIFIFIVAEAIQAAEV
jgi:hypothetical protein